MALIAGHRKKEVVEDGDRQAGVNTTVWLHRQLNSAAGLGVRSKPCKIHITLPNFKDRVCTKTLKYVNDNTGVNVRGEASV